MTIRAAALAITALSVPAPRPGWFLCDGIDRPVAWLVGKPDAAGRAAITRVDKRTGGTSTARYAVGRADPGAGNIYYALTREGRPVGHLRALNPGMAPRPQDATTPLFTEVRIDGVTTQCRWLARTAMAGVTARRGVAITREGGRLTYRTFDFAKPSPVVRPDGVARSNRPSLAISGGAERRLPGGGSEFRFANRGWTYVVSLGGDAGAAMLTVLRDGRIVQREPFLGATLGD